MPDLEEKVSVVDIIKQDYDLILGTKKDIFSKDFSTTNDNDRLFMRMDDMDRFNSNYDEKFLIKVMNHLFRFVLKKSGTKEKLVAYNAKQARKCFYKFADILDVIKLLSFIP